MSRAPVVSDLKNWLGPQIQGSRYNDNNASIIDLLTSGNFDFTLGNLSADFIYGNISNATGFPSTDLTLTASEDISEGDLVRISGNQFFKTINSSDAGITDVYGFAVTGVLSGNTVTARNGIYYSPNTIAVGNPYYVGDVAGAITTVKPSSRAKFVGIGVPNNGIVMVPNIELSPTFPYINVSNYIQTAGIRRGYVAKTTNYTTTLQDYTIAGSGSAFPVSLITAVGNAGVEYNLIKTDSSLTNIITIDPNGSETIGGVATTTLNTLNESLTIISDGANWIIKSREIPSIWTAQSAIGISATTSAPTKGSPQLVDVVNWDRDGIYAIVEYKYCQAATGSAGSGDYLFSLPTGLTMDTGKVTFNITVGPDNSQFGLPLNGSWTRAGTSDSEVGILIPYNTTSFRVGFTVASVGGSRIVSSANYGLNLANLTYYFTAKIPISGWNS